MSISILDCNIRHELVSGTLTKEEISLSNQLRLLYPAHINNLKLEDVGDYALTLDKNSNGSFRDYVTGYLAESAQPQLDAGRKPSNRNWLTVKNDKVATVDSNKYIKAASRRKIPPALDGVDLSIGENQLFDNAQTDKQHFIELSMWHSTAENAAMADTGTAKIMNPLNYIGISRVKVPQN